MHHPAPGHREPSHTNHATCQHLEPMATESAACSYARGDLTVASVLVRCHFTRHLQATVLAVSTELGTSKRTLDLNHTVLLLKVAPSTSSSSGMFWTFTKGSSIWKGVTWSGNRMLVPSDGVSLPLGAERATAGQPHCLHVCHDVSLAAGLDPIMAHGLGGDSFVSRRPRFLSAIEVAGSYIRPQEEMCGWSYVRN